MGVAVAVGTDESGGGRVQHVDDTGAAPAFADTFGEGESRMALALKAGIDLSWDDLRAVNLDRHPLLQKADIVFHHFNSAASYSGPAAVWTLSAEVIRLAKRL